jgi:hypothetical protein
MKEFTTSAAVVPSAIVEEAWQEVGVSFERFCRAAIWMRRPLILAWNAPGS